MKLINYLKSKKGFTLVELMVVIGIIGILAGIMVPKLGGIQNKAKNAAIASLASTVRTGLEIYYAENEAYPEYDEKEFSEDGWEVLDQLLDSIQLGEESQYNLDKIEYADNTADLDKYLIKFISSDSSKTEFFLGEKSFERTNSSNEASALNFNSEGI